jgi:hypothetical protein
MVKKGRPIVKIHASVMSDVRPRARKAKAKTTRKLAKKAKKKS